MREKHYYSFVVSDERGALFGSWLWSVRLAAARGTVRRALNRRQEHYTELWVAHSQQCTCDVHGSEIIGYKGGN